MKKTIALLSILLGSSFAFGEKPTQSPMGSLLVTNTLKDPIEVQIKETITPTQKDYTKHGFVQFEKRTLKPNQSTLWRFYKDGKISQKVSRATPEFLQKNHGVVLPRKQRELETDFKGDIPKHYNLYMKNLKTGKVQTCNRRPFIKHVTAKAKKVPLMGWQCSSNEEMYHSSFESKVKKADANLTLN